MRAPRGRLARHAGAGMPRLVRPLLLVSALVLRHGAHALHAQARLAVATAACCAAYALLALLRLATSPAPAEGPAADVCVAWRATTCGTQYSGRLPLQDLHCSALIRPSDKRISGYCECADQRLDKAEVALLCGKGLQAEWKKARMRPFTCQEACEAKWKRRGPTRREDPHAGCDALPAEASRPGGRSWADVAPPPLQPAQADAVRALWNELDEAFLVADGLSVVLPPGHRGFGGWPGADFVAAGRHMPTADVARARSQWRRFYAAAPRAPPPALFAGRGVVIVSGGLKYAVPAWVALSALRRAGCALPAELWFPPAELPDAAFADALRHLGAAVRNADDVYPGGSAAAFHAGFALKAVAVLFSRFEEVLFIDADNVALRDPSNLFEWQPYRDAGMLLWPDFWPRSAAPDAFAIAPEARSAYDGAAANRSVESGQLLLHKGRAWGAATMAWFINMQGALYYRLLCSYMGAGDKETWAFAAALAGGPPPARVATPAGSAGVPGEKHPEHLLSNTMLQHHPADGQLLFAHANMFKWTLEVPTAWSRYSRRWRTATPPGWDAASLAHGAPPLLARDPLPPPAVLVAAERAAWEALRALRCAPWFDRTLALRRGRFGEVAPDAADAGAPVTSYRGMLLSEHAGGTYQKEYAWRWGWTGPYLERVRS